MSLKLYILDAERHCRTHSVVFKFLSLDLLKGFFIIFKCQPGSVKKGNMSGDARKLGQRMAFPQRPGNPCKNVG